MFETTSDLPMFWIELKAEYPEIATEALKSLLLFPASSLCEAVFSAMKATMTRLWSRLDISSTLRASLSPVTPRWDWQSQETKLRSPADSTLWWVV